MSRPEWAWTKGEDAWTGHAEANGIRVDLAASFIAVNAQITSPGSQRTAYREISDCPAFDALRQELQDAAERMWLNPQPETTADDGGK